MLQAAIQHVESNGNPNAVSPQGATGTMQIMPATFAQYAKPGEVYTNDADRTAAALRKISDDYNHFGGDIGKTAAAYIGGRGAINADGSIRDDVADSLGTTPAAYSQKVLATMQQMRNGASSTAPGGASGPQPAPTMSVPAAVSHTSAYKFNPKTGLLEPTPEFQMAEANVEYANPGAGADLRKVNEPSDAEKLSAALQRVGANSPAGIAIQRQLDQLGYIAPVSLRSERYIDSKGNVHTLPGSAPQGFMNVHNDDGSWSTVKINGGPEAVAAEETAKAQGTAQSQTWEKQKAAADQVPGILARIKTLEPLLDQFTSGAGAQQLATWKSWAATHGVPVDVSATNAAQEFKKYTSQMLAEQRVGMGGSATDAAQDMAEAGSANIGLGNDVNRNVLAFAKANALGTLAFQTAKQGFINQHGGTITPNQASNFDSQWNQNYDPRIILYSHMQPTQRDAFIASMSPADAQDFERKFSGYTNIVNQYK